MSGLDNQEQQKSSQLQNLVEEVQALKSALEKQKADYQALGERLKEQKIKNAYLLAQGNPDTYEYFRNRALEETGADEKKLEKYIQKIKSGQSPVAAMFFPDSVTVTEVDGKITNTQKQSNTTGARIIHPNDLQHLGALGLTLADIKESRVMVSPEATPYTASPILKF